MLLPIIIYFYINNKETDQIFVKNKSFIWQSNYYNIILYLSKYLK